MDTQQIVNQVNVSHITSPYRQGGCENLIYVVIKIIGFLVKHIQKYGLHNWFYYVSDH